MSQAEELLNSLNLDDVVETESDHPHEIIDSDNYFVIDPVTRVIENTSRQDIVLMQFDHDSERFTFELPRYVEGHDMSLCDVVEIHYINVGSNGTKNVDIYDVYDLHVDPDNQNKVLCSWLVSRQATQLAGKLTFLIRYQCVNVDGTTPYEWHSDIFSDVIVKEGMNNGERIMIENSDLLEQWRSILGSLTVSELSLTVRADSWTLSENGAYYVQTLDIPLRTNGQIELRPTGAQLASLIAQGISMFVGNVSGVAVAHAIGGIPMDDMTIKAIETVVTRV